MWGLSDHFFMVLKAAFGGAIILAGGLTLDSTENLIARGLIDMAAERLVLFMFN